MLKEVQRLRKQPFGSSEASVIRNYLDLVLELPWNATTKEAWTSSRPGKMLDEDHYGLEKVKERILEFLAVRQLSAQVKGGVLCLVGPPGVGKTSIAMSIARASTGSWPASPWAASMTRRRSAATARPISAPCPAASSPASPRPAPAIP